MQNATPTGANSRCNVLYIHQQLSEIELFISNISDRLIETESSNRGRYLRVFCIHLYHCLLSHHKLDYICQIFKMLCFMLLRQSHLLEWRNLYWTCLRALFVREMKLWIHDLQMFVSVHIFVCGIVIFCYFLPHCQIKTIIPNIPCIYLYLIFANVVRHFLAVFIQKINAFVKLCRFLPPSMCLYKVISIFDFFRKNSSFHRMVDRNAYLELEMDDKSASGVQVIFALVIQRL